MSKSNCLLVILQKKLITWVEGEATSLKMGRDIIKYQKKSFNIFQIQREGEKKNLEFISENSDSH